MQETVGESREGKRERRNDNEKKMGNRIERYTGQKKSVGKHHLAQETEKEAGQLLLLST